MEITDKMVLAALEKTRPHKYQNQPWEVPTANHHPNYEIFTEMKNAIQAALDVR